MFAICRDSTTSGMNKTKMRLCSKEGQ
ncbi:unnamed protein product, partial [Rotaria magnacalcarata]